MITKSLKKITDLSFKNRLYHQCPFLFTKVDATPIKDPNLLHVNRNLLSKLELADSEIVKPSFLRFYTAEVYSYRAVEVTFRPPVTLNVPPPSAYQVQVSSSPVFDASMTTAATAMGVADVTAPVLNLGGLRTGTVYYVRIAVPPSIRSIAGVTFPQPLAPLYTTPGECCVMLVRSEMCQLRGTKFGV